MSLHPLAGKPAPEELLIDVPKLVTAFFTNKPDPDDPCQQVCFGTSGHRGSAFTNSFNEEHIAAVAQAVAEHRASRNITGPLFMGKDTHALSEPAAAVALEVFAANGVHVRIQEGGGYTPTPVISHAILTWNRGNGPKADGVVITPSHNPPADGGFKYNPPHGGPAGADTTKAIQDRANELLAGGLRGVKRIAYERALKEETTRMHDYVQPYVDDLKNVVDMQAIAGAGLKIGVDPMGGSGIAYWEPIAEHYGLDLELVSTRVDPTFSFMTVDKDGKIRMDCSSQYAMASLIGLKDRFDIAFGNDPDFDRHGIVTQAGLMNPNHYIAAAVWRLFQTRGRWRSDAAIGKTLVTSSIIDRIAAHLNRRLAEVPVGFKWFVDGLLAGEYGFGGEESAGASFLRFDGSVWTTDKDGIIMNLLAAEITAATGKDPQQHYFELTQQFGAPIYERLQASAGPERKAAFKQLSPDMITATSMAGEPITQVLTKSPEGGNPLGGLKVCTENGWFAARPSGTEDIYKIYTESFKGTEHLKQLQDEAQAIVDAAFTAAGV